MAEATADFFIANTPTDGVPYWDTGAPGPRHAWATTSAAPAEPFNDHEPVDSSAAAIAAQGLLRLGNCAGGARAGRPRAGATARPASPWRARCSPSRTSRPIPRHEGLLLHTVYHRPNGWDHVPPGRKVPCGESAMWGDYHARELALLIQREAEGGPYLKFFLD